MALQPEQRGRWVLESCDSRRWCFTGTVNGFIIPIWPPASGNDSQSGEDKDWTTDRGSFQRRWEWERKHSEKVQHGENGKLAVFMVSRQRGREVVRTSETNLLTETLKDYLDQKSLQTSFEWIN